MKPFLLTLVLSLLLCSFCCDADFAGTLQPLTVSVHQASTSTVEPEYYALVNAGTNQLIFSLPQGFRMGGQPAQGNLQMINSDFGGFITFTVAAPDSDNATEPARAVLAARYPRGKVTQAFDRPILGRSCQVTDIEWTNARYAAEKTRVLFVPSSAGMIEITFTCGPQDFGRGVVQLNWLLNSLKLNAREGREIIHLQGFN